MDIDSTVNDSVQQTRSEIEFEWTIPDFFSLPEYMDYCKTSPCFDFLGMKWRLKVLPYLFEDPVWIGVYLVMEFDAEKKAEIEALKELEQSEESPGCRQFSELAVSFTLSLKTANGNAVGKQTFTHDFSYDGDNSGSCQFYTRSKLMERSSQLALSGAITIICSIRPYDRSRYKITDDVKRREEDTQTETKRHTDALSENLQSLLNGNCHDLTLKVKGREFRAHQSILRARSEVFDSALNMVEKTWHDMVKKNTGVITISDCDPAAFEQFLIYVYSGKLETLDQSNMLGLYYIADKYHMPELKEESGEFIKKSLSPGVICDVILFAMNHCDSDMISYATDYFVANMSEILQTVEWQSFMVENAAHANELLIRTAKIWNSWKEI